MVKRPDLRDVMSFRMGNRTRRGRASLTIPDELMLGCSIRMFHEFFGREPDYLSGVETQVHDVAWPSIIIAIIWRSSALRYLLVGFWVG